MALDQGTSALTVKSQERTWRINIETPLGGDPVVTVFREVVRTATDGSLISRDPAGSIERSVSAVVGQSFELAGHTCTVTQIAGVIASIADLWRQQDIAAQAKD